MKLTYDGDLFDAIELGDLESAKIYWSEDIEIDYQEKGGNSMLMLAVSYGFKDVVEFLLSKQPNLNLKNDQGQTAAVLYPMVFSLRASKRYSKTIQRDSRGLQMPFFKACLIMLSPLRKTLYCG
jgi:hypothetical protein